jgi:hypothetical protein
MGQACQLMGCLIGFPIDVVEATLPKPTLITADTPNDVANIISRVTIFTIDRRNDSCVITFKLNILEAAIFGEVNGVVDSESLS